MIKVNKEVELFQIQIERQSYTSKEEMQQKLDIFLVGDRITQPQYEELTAQLNAA